MRFSAFDTQRKSHDRVLYNTILSFVINVYNIERGSPSFVLHTQFKIIIGSVQNICDVVAKSYLRH